MCPYRGVREIAKQVQWHGQAAFQHKATDDESSYPKMKMAGSEYGNYVQEGNLMFARIFGAGHMPMEKKGLQVRDLYMKWMAGAPMS